MVTLQLIKVRLKNELPVKKKPLRFEDKVIHLLSFLLSFILFLPRNYIYITKYHKQKNKKIPGREG